MLDIEGGTVGRQLVHQKLEERPGRLERAVGAFAAFVRELHFRETVRLLVTDEAMEERARSRGVGLERARLDAEKMFREIAANMNSTFLAILNWVVGGVTRRLFASVEVAGLEKVTEYAPTAGELTIALGVYAVGALVLTVLYKIAAGVREELES